MLQLCVPCILICGSTALFGVDKLLFGCKADAEGRLSVSHLFERLSTGGDWLEYQRADRIDALGLQIGREAPVRRCLVFISQSLGVVHEHLVDVVDLKRGKHIIFIVDGVLVAWQGYVTLRGEDDVVDGELLWQILLPID